MTVFKYKSVESVAFALSGFGRPLFAKMWTVCFVDIAITTLQLNSYISDPNRAMLIVLGAMFMAPVLVRRMRAHRMAE